ncbi:hypothetical protein B0J13DRAFT_567684 [Dactylonectria estremocensis]|uniref:Uncharacterized protein n=1 Tax=Dactylonectria estremocensis TaxID=1079267 RepID=A0A9P9DJW5_9HYPO|nr:hypothetical protein B0J13DRAFT_567684 [Dactylonectria estremocensis]
MSIDSEYVGGWWSAFFKGGFNWRWLDSPSLHYRPKLRYCTHGKYVTFDGMGREAVHDELFDATIDPETGEYVKLYVQAPVDLCLHPNATWKRTVIRNVAPLFVRFANIPFSYVPEDRRYHFSSYTPEDWAAVALMWLPSVLFLQLTMLIMDYDQPAGKNSLMYLPLLYGGYRYPRLARNYRENRPELAVQRKYDPSWASFTVGTYRTFRPRRLCHLNFEEQIDEEGNRQQVVVGYDLRFMPPEDNTPYVVVAYTTAQFEIREGTDDYGMLMALALTATGEYINSIPDAHHKPRAIWMAHSCTPIDRYLDDDGTERWIDANTPEGRIHQEKVMNDDTYSISDVLRGAERVIIIAGNPLRPSLKDPLKEWGERVWTLPEILLAKGDSVSVYYSLRGDGKIESVSKSMFPIVAWDDAIQSRQLIDHFTNLHLSRLELINIAVECLMSRNLKPLHAGDRSYALMGLLRIRPPIDGTDTSFQAFARLSLPQDNDRLMERLICLLPNDPSENWELMTDQYRCSLWDIQPDTQVCGVGENDSVIISGAKGALIEWDMFSPVQTLQRQTIKRMVILTIIIYSPVMFYTGIGLVASGDKTTGGILLAIALIFFMLPSPYYIWKLVGGKIHASEPCLFGFEGYVPIGIVEERIFGMCLNRLQWSPYGSPLSRHIQGAPINERFIQYSEDSASEPQLLPKQVGVIETYPVIPIDPTSGCAHCAGRTECTNHETVASIREKGLSNMGRQKVFTLVDTFNMMVTLFYAERPPISLIVGGSEGGMKRAIACSLDLATGTLYRETILRIPTRSADRMDALDRVRLGLRRPFLESDVAPIHEETAPQPPSLINTEDNRTAQNSQPGHPVYGDNLPPARARTPRGNNRGSSINLQDLGRRWQYP